VDRYCFQGIYQTPETSMFSELILTRNTKFAYLSVAGSAGVSALPGRYVRTPSRFPKPLAVERATFLKPRVVRGLFRAV
jgi:hypothetical protein